MRKLVVLLFLLLALFPSVHTALEAWEHSHHSHAVACEEEGTHMHPKEAHCQVDQFTFFSVPWEAISFQKVVRQVYLQRDFTAYHGPLTACESGKTDVRGPPSRTLFANV